MNESISPHTNFMVFDIRTSNREGSEPQVFYSSNENTKNPHSSVNLAGLLITFVKFSNKFEPDEPCDYILTSASEIALCELEDGIWMSYSRPRQKISNRNGLHQMLISCRRIYQLFFNPPVRDENRMVSPKSIRQISQAFQMIVKSITNTELNATQLFDSYLKLDLPPRFMNDITQTINFLIHSANSPISHVAVMYSHNFIYSSFPPDITKTLDLALRVKFPYLFPQVLEKQEKLFWIIGLSKGKNVPLNVYVPPLFINGHQYPLCALRHGKMRYLLALKSDVLPTPEMLSTIPGHLVSLKGHFENFQVELYSTNNKSPYVTILSDTDHHKLDVSNQFIPEAVYGKVQNNMILGHYYGKTFSGCSSIGFTADSQFFIFYRYIDDIEILTALNTRTQNVSKSIALCKELDDQKKRLKVVVRRNSQIL